MVARMSESEDAQLAGFVCFLKSNKLDRALQAHDWTTFARGYNGPTFAKNNYDTNLRFLQPPYFPSLGNAYVILVQRQV